MCRHTSHKSFGRDRKSCQTHMGCIDFRNFLSLYQADTPHIRLPRRMLQTGLPDIGGTGRCQGLRPSPAGTPCKLVGLPSTKSLPGNPCNQPQPSLP
mmetsp:Transcript_13011/g.29701  ORF Transcript_13011/g.29701 Transcript_13011/m.29701 type:complete len:97 (+) Transcript_13011:228-518(+)